MKRNLKNRRKRLFFAGGLVLTVLLLAAAAVLALPGIRDLLFPGTVYTPAGTQLFTRAGGEDYSEDNTVCRVTYVNEDGKYTLTVPLPFEEWEALDEGHTLTGYLYRSDTGVVFALDHPAAEGEDLSSAARDAAAGASAERLNAALACLLAAVGFLIMTFAGRFFSLYEKIWFLSILVLAAVFAILFPEEDCNGVNGILIMALYLADTLFNILCELLISKQSKWNFLVSVLVEITEIAICVVLAYRFATMATTLFFWLPIDIISFINWNRHPDREEAELTVVRRLRGWQEILVLAGIFVWTVGVGYLLTLIDLGTDLFGGNEVLETVVCYLDACASAVGIANGLFILFRYREQWIAWYLSALLEAAINVLSGQYVLLILKFGYLTNTTYGYVRWTQYIRSHTGDAASPEAPASGKDGEPDAPDTDAEKRLLPAGNADAMRAGSPAKALLLGGVCALSVLTLLRCAGKLFCRNVPRTPDELIRGKKK